MEQDSDSEHASKSTTERLKKRKESKNLKPSERLKRAVQINACNPKGTEAVMQRRVGHNSYTTMWDTDKVMWKTVT